MIVNLPVQELNGKQAKIERADFNQKKANGT